MKKGLRQALLIPVSAQEARDMPLQHLQNREHYELLLYFHDNHPIQVLKTRAYHNIQKGLEDPESIAEPVIIPAHQFPAFQIYYLAV